MRPFKVFTVGWDPALASDMFGGISSRTGIAFTHGLVGDSRRVPIISKAFPDSKWVAVGRAAGAALPPPDYDLLTSLECIGVPTIRSMVRGDQTLRNRNPTEAFAYLTFLARRLNEVFAEAKPDLVLGSHDCAHGALALAVAKSMSIPWVAMTFTSIPANLVGFCKGMTPEQLLPIERVVDDALRGEARAALSRVRSRSQWIKAYRPPETLNEKVRQVLSHARNLTRRFTSRRALGVDRFTFPTVTERLADLTRRALNGLRLPTDMMLEQPPAAPYVFFPLHMVPESSLDTWAPMYQNQFELIVQISLAVPSDMDVVVKLHFSDPDNYSRRQLQQLTQLPRLRVAHPNASSFAFLEQATLVAGIAGTGCLEAALLGKPVLLFGDSPFRHFPRTQRARRPDELHAQIRGMIDLPAPTEEAIVEAFTAHIARYLPGRHNDFSKPIEEEEFERLADCFRALRSYVEVPRNRDTWYQQSPFVSNDWREDHDLYQEGLIRA